VLLGLFLVLVNLVVGTPDTVVEDRSLSREVEQERSLPESGVPLEESTGTVVLDIREGSFTIVPGEPGDPIRVDGRFDTGSFELTEEFSRTGELGWEYRVRFGPKRGWWLRLFSSEANQNRIRITIPRNMPLVLEGYAGLGEFDFEFGGLWLAGADLELGAGEHRIRFSEPLVLPAEAIDFNGSFGAITVRDLGNASPGRFVVTQTAGELHVDLRGAWRNDATLEVRNTFGQIRVDAPDNARLVVESASVSLGEKRVASGIDESELPEDAPTLRLETSLTTGEIRVR
jgi:hypothetical protein